MQDIKQQFVKDFQARYEIHPQELGLIADFWLEKISLAVEQEKERIVDGVNKLTPFNIGVGQDPLISKDSVLTLINNK